MLTTALKQLHCTAHLEDVQLLLQHTTSHERHDKRQARDDAKVLGH